MHVTLCLLVLTNVLREGYSSYFHFNDFFLKAEKQRN